MIDSRRRYSSVGEAFEVWKNYLVSMGYGYKLGIDLPGENRGFLPNSEYYDKYHGKRWSSSTVISIAIGQGEVLATHCRFVIWRQPSLTGDILLLRMS